VRLSHVFLVTLAAGCALGYWTSDRSDAPATTATSLSSPAAPIGERRVRPEREAAEPPASPIQAKGPAVSSKQAIAAPAEPTEAELAHEKAERLAAKEPLDRDNIRELLEQAFDGRLERELSASDYERLADAFLRVRAAERIIRRVDESAASAELLAAQREVLQNALVEVEHITGMTPSELGEIISKAPLADELEETQDD
jgi:hypothetical protein